MFTKRKYSIERAETRDAWIMLAPALIVIAVIAVFPILRAFWLSLHEMVLTNPGSGFPFVGLDNYIAILSDTRALSAITFTIRFTVISVVLELIIGFGAALLMSRKFRGRGLVRASILVPWAIPTSVSAMMWKFIFNDQYGMFNNILYRLRIIDSYQAWLATSDGAFMALVIADVWKTAPFIALLILAGLQMIPEELYEAGKIDGGGAIQRFVHITLPLVSGTVLIALLFRTMDAFRVFELISVMTGGALGTDSVSLYAHRHMMRFLDFGYGSALSVMIFVFCFIISLFYLKLLGNKLSV